ncbi:EAL domain-containing protein [Novosphingobium sp. 1949]|uniref:EAL domain-containing protein n=1 Tax=Novosphingobium organovorum TaxID=2930092 RepID=A0ABT0BHK6_9SPHN|nr:EAL domain-containing protein [Novosphingobium organovorum]MCJ2184338.1 EAL domain-containing protein [Novosphingobium organovorum]
MLLAILVCTMASATTVLLLRQACGSQGGQRRSWSMLAGAALGFGAWSSHFIALLGYNTPNERAYSLELTLLSLAAGGGLSLLATLWMASSRTLPIRVFGSVLLAGGLGAMHYTGMAALQIPATMRWDPAFVGASIVLPALILYATLAGALSGHGLRRAVLATLLLVAASATLHLFGMAALTLVPARTAPIGMLVTPGTLAGWVTAIALAVFATGMAAQVIRTRAHSAYVESQCQFGELVKSVADYAIVILDAHGRIAQWNEGARKLTGYDAVDILGMPVARLFSIEDRNDDLPARTLEYARNAGSADGECLYLRRDGSTFWGHGTIQATRSENGTLQGYSFVMRDIQPIKEAKDLVAQTSMRLDTALTNMHEGLCLFDAEEHLVLCNARFRQLWNLTDAQCEAGTTLAELIRAGFMNPNGERHAEPGLTHYRELLQTASAHPDAPPMVVEFDDLKAVSIANRALPDGGWVMTCDDITEQRQSEARIAHMALHDALTGLPNRTRFNQRLHDKLGTADRTSSKVGVIAIDLDRFKEVNDTQGHAAGDALLQAIGRRITEQTLETEVVARLGGDEFAAAKVFSEAHELHEFANRLHGCIVGTSVGTGTFVGASLGIAIYPQDGGVGEALLNNADLAMYRAKAQRGEHICYYEEGMDETARRRRQIANDLRHAIANGELHLLYQPQRSLRTGALSGYEALLRWQHPRHGFIPPDVFIPIAEETGSIFEIGEWVLRDACREAKQWPGEEKVAVNLSAVQFIKPDLVSTIRQILADTGLSPTRLELEITETAIIGDKLRALHCLRQLKAMGISVAIDDFGTGYSSLDTLHSFPFDKIKIDKSFLLRSENSAQARAIISAVLALGKSLQIPVLAEGVENEAQLLVLESEGCDEAQGYYFGRPDTPPSHHRKAVANS